jgi:hypothetical protein
MGFKQLNTDLVAGKLNGRKNFSDRFIEISKSFL